MDDMSTAYEWAKGYEFDEVELHYATILTLKILDDACKMDYDNYNLFMSVYDGIIDKTSNPLNNKVHQIIALARDNDPIVPSQEYKEVIHTLRVLIIKDMHKPFMKAFKKLVWENTHS